MVLRIFKIIATSGFLTTLECIKFIFGRDAASIVHRGAFSAPSELIGGLRALLLRGGGDDKKGKGREEGERKGIARTAPPFANSWIRP